MRDENALDLWDDIRALEQSVKCIAASIERDNDRLEEIMLTLRAIMDSLAAKITRIDAIEERLCRLEFEHKPLGPQQETAEETAENIRRLEKLMADFKHTSSGCALEFI